MADSIAAALRTPEINGSVARLNDKPGIESAILTL